MFEGLGIGSRLASADFPGGRSSYIPILAAVVFGLSTPLGLTVGLILVVRRSYYSPESDAGALILSGVLDSLSAGILIYTGLVEVRRTHLVISFSLLLHRADRGA
jgi:zinc transporter 1/2/3